MNALITPITPLAISYILGLLIFFNFRLAASSLYAAVPLVVLVAAVVWRLSQRRSIYLLLGLLLAWLSALQMRQQMENSGALKNFPDPTARWQGLIIGKLFDRDNDTLIVQTQYIKPLDHFA